VLPGQHAKRADCQSDGSRLLAEWSQALGSAGWRFSAGIGVYRDRLEGASPWRSSALLPPNRGLDDVTLTVAEGFRVKAAVKRVDDEAVAFDRGPEQL
jgi:hypothetical protein